MLKKVAYAFGVLAILAGIWGLDNRFVFGHQDAAYGSYVVWGLWVAMYLFFADGGRRFNDRHSGSLVSRPCLSGHRQDRPLGCADQFGCGPSLSRSQI